MNDKDIDLRVLENADDDTIRKIAADCPSSDEAKERMFAMSRKIYNSRTNEREYNKETEVSGVEIYRKPKWHKFTAVAAALLIVTGVTAGGVMLTRNKGDHKIVNSEIEASTSPFGDLSDFRVRIMSTATAPSVFEPGTDKKLALTEALNNAEWNELSADTPVPDGERQIIYFKKGNETFSLIVCTDGTIYYSSNSNEERYQIDDETQNVIYQALKYEPESGDKLISIDADSVDDIDMIWQDTTEPEVTTEPEINTEPVTNAEKNDDMSEVYFPPLNKTVKVPTNKCSFFTGEWDEKTAFSCENVPELIEAFGKVKWNKRTDIPTGEYIVTASFRCSDDKYIYSYDIYYNDYIVLKYEDIVSGEMTTEIYSTSTDEDVTLYSAFREAEEKITSQMLPDEWFTHEIPNNSFISRKDEIGVITPMDETDEKEFVNALTSASWEKLPDETVTGECIYKLRFFAHNSELNLNIYNDGTAYIEQYSKYRISESLVEDLARISDNVWAKISPENYTDKMPANKEEVFNKAKEFYDKALKYYYNFGPEGCLNLEIAEGIAQQFEDGSAGWLIKNVNSIDEINDMYHEFFSDRYPENDIRKSNYVFEKDGHVYMRPSGKGSNILFQSTELSDVLYQKDDEIFFTVNNNYSEVEFGGNTTWTEKLLFSVVIQPDGSWKVGKITCPW